MKGISREQWSHHVIRHKETFQTLFLLCKIYFVMIKLIAPQLKFKLLYFRYSFSNMDYFIIANRIHNSNGNKTLKVVIFLFFHQNVNTMTNKLQLKMLLSFSRNNDGMFRMVMGVSGGQNGSRISRKNYFNFLCVTIVMYRCVCL